MTQQEFNIAIPDTSCLILLSKIGELELLNKVFNTVYITEDVSKEYQKNKFSLFPIGL
jgi:predicted nucleic acid-binding protein